jgi:hypothetical protein
MADRRGVSALAAAMAALPEPPSDSRPPYWDFWRHDLWTRAQTDDPANFWHWPCVRHTMTVEHFPVADQLAALQTEPARWLPVIGDRHPHHARNLIHQAYHLQRWEEATGRRIETLNAIVEFGGGYGAMCDLARRLGFAGTYTIVDLPEFALLQRHFLDERGVAVVHAPGPHSCDLFVAIYSLSETDAAVRARYLTGRWANSYLLLYSGRWAEHDNAAWASEVAASRPDLSWLDEPFPGRPDNYLIGWRP